MNVITYLGSKKHLLKLFLEGNEKKTSFWVFLCEIAMLVIYLFVVVVEIWWRWKVTLGLQRCRKVWGSPKKPMVTS